MEVNQEAVKWLEEKNVNSEMVLFMNNILEELPGSASLAGIENDEMHLTKHDYTDIDFTWLYG